MQHFISSAIEKVDIAGISNVQLTRLIQDASGQDGRLKMGLGYALMVSYAIKEAYRLGEIRGRVVNKS